MNRQVMLLEAQLGHDLADFFGITMKESDDIFTPTVFNMDIVAMTPDYYKTLKQKADRYDDLSEDLR